MENHVFPLEIIPSPTPRIIRRKPEEKTRHNIEITREHSHPPSGSGEDGENNADKGYF